MPSTKTKSSAKKTVKTVRKQATQIKTARPTVFQAPPPPFIPERVITPPTPPEISNKRPGTKWGSYLIALAVFLFPFITWSYTLSIHEFPKQLFLTLFVGIGLVAIIIQLFKKGTFELFPRHPIVPLGVVALLLAFISALRSGLLWQGLLGYLGNESLSVLGLLMLAIWMLLVFHYSRENSNLPIYALILSGSIVSLLTIFSLAGLNLYTFVSSAGFNPVGTTTMINILAAITIILAIGTYLHSTTTKGKLCSLLAILPPLILALGTGFHITFILIAAGLGLLILFSLLEKNQTNSALATSLLLVAMIITIILAIFPLTTFLQTPLEVGPAHKETWSIVQNTLSEKPLLGSGPGTFAADYLQYRSLPILQTPFWNVSFDLGSSTGLTMLATFGWLGAGLLIISILIILAQYLRSLFNNTAESASPCFTPTLSYTLLASGIVLFIAGWLAPLSLTVHFFFATMLGLMLARLNLSPLRLNPNELVRSFIGVIIIFIIIGLFIIQGTRAAADILAHQSLNMSNPNLEIIASKLQKATQLDPYNDTYPRLLSNTQRATLQQRLNTNPTSQDQQALLQKIRGLADNALSNARLAIKRAPKQVTNWTTLGNVYLDIAPIASGAAQAAVDAFTQAQKLSPADPEILVNLSIARSNLTLASAEDKNAAVESLRKAIGIRPSFSIAHIELARLVGAQGNIDEALTEYKNAEAITPKDAALRYEIGLFLLQNEKYAEAQVELEAAIAITSNFSNARWFLAQAYEKQENLDQAIEQIEKVIELNPDNQQAEDRLEELKKLK